WCSGDQCAGLDSGAEGTADFNFDTSAGNDWTCGGGSWGSEVSWSLSCDGSEVASGGVGEGCFGTCEDDGGDDNNCTLTMNDAFGDGWNGNEWCSGDQCAGLDSGAEGTAGFNFDTSAANEYTCGGGSWQSEVSWTLSCDDGTTASGGAPDAGCFGACGDRDVSAKLFSNDKQTLGESLKKVAKRAQNLGRTSTSNSKAILFESKLQRANSVKLIQTAEGLSYEADGFVGFEITLEHSADFEINVTKSAFIADYKTTGNTTKLIVVAPETTELFSSTGD
ncbi:uncharacterized protein METZ01_LOCUS409365, partial [marine metagenome]